LGNEEEVALLQFAVQKTQNDEVKQMATMMIKDHQEAITKLQSFATHGRTSADPSANTTGASGTAISEAGRGAAPRESRKVTGSEDPTSPVGGATAHGAMNGIAGQLHQLARREKEVCLKMTKEDLSKQEGANFDKALVGQQCVMHTTMLAKLTALQGQTSPELNRVTQELARTTAHHKQHLEKMMEKLAEKTESAARR